MNDSWKVLQSKVGFEGGWWRLRLDQCQTPAEVVIEDYPVLEYPDWVNVVALRQSDGKIILTQEYRHAVSRMVLGLPGGTVDPEEQGLGEAGTEAAAIRELLEETGYLAIKMVQTGTFLPNAATHSNTLTSYLAPDVVPHASASLDDEAGTKIALQFMDLDQLIADLRAGSLMMESGHVAAIYAAYAYLSEGASSDH